MKNMWQNAVEFAGPEYAQNYISARWSDGDGWVTADNDAHDQPYHANDHNNHVFWTGYCFLDYGYNKINHTYENGVAVWNKTCVY